MSENIELVRSIYDRWERGEWDPGGWADPAIEYLAGDGVESEVATGISRMADSWGRFLETWDEFTAEAEEFLELDASRVLVLVARRGRGRASGVHVHGKSAHLFEIRNRKVVRLVHYWDRDRALSDLGLER